MMANTISAIGLMSGGLDSILAVHLMHNLEVCMHLVRFKAACWHYDRENSETPDILSKQLKRLGLTLHEPDITEEYLEILRYPRHGRGSAFNPCIDCKIFMLRKAKEMMPEFGAEFVFTGEVIGQRPMSQNRDSMRVVERESGLEGLLLRPLCARLMEPTIPERTGRIDRTRLLHINGRSRHEQLALAKEWGIEEIPPIGGGCILTDRNFGARMFDLLAHDELNLPNILLAKVGRHFRLSDRTKAVVGRDERENLRITALAGPEDRLIELETLNGPTTILRGQIDNDGILQAASLTCRYAHVPPDQSAKISVIQPNGETETLTLEGEVAGNVDLRLL